MKCCKLTNKVPITNIQFFNSLSYIESIKNNSLSQVNRNGEYYLQIDKHKQEKKNNGDRIHYLLPSFEDSEFFLYIYNLFVLSWYITKRKRYCHCIFPRRHILTNLHS